MRWYVWAIIGFIIFAVASVTSSIVHGFDKDLGKIIGFFALVGILLMISAPLLGKEWRLMLMKKPFFIV